MGYILQSARLNATTHLGCFLLLKRNLIKRPSTPTKLAEVGRLEVPKNDGKYETGQLFLHRIFGYRGVVLFPWTARIYDRDIHNSRKQQTASSPGPDKIGNINDAATKIKAATGTITSSTATTTSSDADGGELPAIEIEKGLTLEPLLGQTKPDFNADTTATTDKTDGSNKNTTTANTASNETSSNTNDPKDIKSKIQTFYQVLIDSRDCPYIRAQTEAVTFLGNQDSNRSLYAIPGLDYVGHDDIMPYTSVDRSPLNHELFDKFLSYNPLKDPPFDGKDTLKAWQEKNHPWLELSDVHKETTENVRVTVIPFYMGCRETPASSVYWWRYCIRLENLGDMSVQLRERHWRIFSLSGTLETVRGRGVVGQEPILSTRLPAFQYSSHVSLQAPSGHMWGTFRLEREDGHIFDCKIPPFSLESKPDENSHKKRID